MGRAAGPARLAVGAGSLAAVVSGPMALFQRRPDLPDDHADAWRAFLDCAQVIESGRRVLLGTLPTGRVEPAPIGVGVEAIEAAITDARGWMPDWRLAQDDLAHEWASCQTALDTAAGSCTGLRETAADTDELEVLLEAVGAVVEPLDAFADAETVWRRTWRIR